MNAALKAHVRQGQIVLDEPTELPEGTELVVGFRDRSFLEYVLAEASLEETEAFLSLLHERLARGMLDEADAEERAELRRTLQERLEEEGPLVSTEEVFREARRLVLASG